MIIQWRNVFFRQFEIVLYKLASYISRNEILHCELYEIPSSHFYEIFIIIYL
jgi:hypothetical protein